MHSIMVTSAHGSLDLTITHLPVACRVLNQSLKYVAKPCHRNRNLGIVMCKIGYIGPELGKLILHTPLKETKLGTHLTQCKYALYAEAESRQY